MTHDAARGPPEPDRELVDAERALQTAYTEHRGLVAARARYRAAVVAWVANVRERSGVPP
jgi:hypothetical protein